MLTAQEHAVEVRRQNRMPIVETGVFGIVRFETFLESRNPGVVDQDVEPSMRPHYRVYTAHPVSLLADVKFLAARTILKVGEDDLRAFGDERSCDGLADSPGRAGDQGYFPFESRHGFEDTH